MDKKIIFLIIGLVGVLLAIGGVFCPWVSVKNELAAGGTSSGDVSGWEMTKAEVGTTQVGRPGGTPFWPNTVDELLILTTKESACFSPNVVLFGCIFMLVLGTPLALAGKPKAARILLMIGAFFALVGALAGFTDYGMGRGTFLAPISGVTAVEQGHGYGIYMCLVGAIMGLACAISELVIWVKKRERWKEI